jgi:hypothetical protein
MFERVAQELAPFAAAMEDGPLRKSVSRRILPTFGRDCGELQKILLNSFDRGLFDNTEQQLIPGSELSVAIATWRLRPECMPADLRSIPNRERPEYLIKQAGLALDVQLEDAFVTLGQAAPRLMVSLFVGPRYLDAFQKLHRNEREALRRVAWESGAQVDSPAPMWRIQCENTAQWLDAFFISKAATKDPSNPTFEGVVLDRDFPCPVVGSHFVFSVLSLAAIFFAVLGCADEGVGTSRLTQWLETRHVSR